MLSSKQDESGGVQPATAGAAASFWLPGEMSKTIPVQDQRWIANTLFHSGKLQPDLKLWYEPRIGPHLPPDTNTRPLLHQSADGVDALPPVESEGVLPSLWETDNRLWRPQEGSEGPGHRQVLPDGDRDTQVHSARSTCRTRRYSG